MSKKLSEMSPEELHLIEKEKHSRRLNQKARRDHVQRTSRLRRIYARIRDHVSSRFGLK